MNYDHAFHAGNPADVVKHAALALILEELARKPAPIHYVETHAGAGVYALTAPEGEWSQGIGRLTSKTARRKLSELAAWLDRLGAEGAPIREYLGSPAIARAMLREDDRLELYELNARDAESLRRAMGDDRRVKIHAKDGWEGLRRLAKLEAPARLVALVDPPFESADEWMRIEEVFVAAAAQHAGATLALWYPIKPGPPHEGRAEALAERLESADVPGLRVELRLRGGLVAPKAKNPRVRPSLTGTGLIVVGAPRRAIARLSSTLPELGAALTRSGAFELTLSGWARAQRPPL